MSLSLLGVSHHTAPVEIRERFAFTPSETTRALVNLRKDGSVDEAVLLSTCNRTELYVLGDDKRALESGRRMLKWKASAAVEDPVRYLYHRRDEEVVRHLFRVSGGLDSMIVGEAEIQGQVKQAYQLALDAPAQPPLAGPVLNRLFQTALSVGGRIRSETSVNEGAASVASVAVELARKIFGELEGRRAMILGAGEMAELTVEALAREGVEGVIVANRTLERAEELAGRLNGEAVSFDRLAESLREVDILVASTGAPHPVLDLERVREAFPDGPPRPLLMVDIAVPRDVEPRVAEETNVFLYNVDDLRKIVDLALHKREEAIPAAERIIYDEVEDFRNWFAGRQVVPMIRSLRSRAERVTQEETERLLNALDHLPEEDREKVEIFAHRILGKILHEPTVRLREAAARGDGPDLLEAARFLYGLNGTDEE